MGNWLSATEGLVAGAVAVVGLLYTYASSRRSQYDRVLNLTAESGKPPVADDRHIAGIAFEPLAKHPSGQPVRLDPGQIKAAFDVLWYFERVYGLYLSLGPGLGRKRITRTQALLLDSLGSSLSSWKTYVDYEWVDEQGGDVDKDEDTVRPLSYLAGERALLAARRDRAPDRRVRLRSSAG